MESIKDHLFKETVRLLRQSPESRTSRDVDTLMEATAEVAFFKQMAKDYFTDEIHRECVKNMTLMYCRAGHYVFNYGDAGDSFYVVLRGQISIQVPLSKTRIEVPEGVDNEKSADFNSNELPPIQRRMVKVARKSEEELQNKPADQAEEPPSSPMAEVKLKGDGYAFGELSLLRDQPRAASIQCTKESWIAKVSRDDFLRILKDYEEKKLTESVNFLRSLTAFKAWTRYSLAKLTYHFDCKRYKLNQVIYRQNDLAEHVFIIKIGEFKFQYEYDEQPLHTHSQFRKIANKKALQMYIKGTSEIFGDDDVIESRRRSLTCVCASLHGELMVIEKADFIRKMQVPGTWDYILERHKKEEEWRDNRLEQLKLSELTKKRLGEQPSVVREMPDTQLLSQSIRKGTDTSRTSSLTPHPQRLSQDAGKKTSFFKTEVEDPLIDFEEIVSHDPTSIKPNTPYDISQNKVNTIPEPRRNMLPACRFSSQMSSRPPPNFFVDPRRAILSRYKFRFLITGKNENMMTPGERSFKRRMMKKTRRLVSLSEERRGPLLAPLETSYMY